MKPLDPIIARQLGIAPSDAKHKPEAERKLQQRLETRPARHYSMVGSWRASVDAKATMTRPAVLGLTGGRSRAHAVRAKHTNPRKGGKGVLAVACPHCTSPIGIRCRMGAGKKPVHKSRVKLAQREGAM
jgi:hypothetical protein